LTPVIALRGDGRDLVGDVVGGFGESAARLDRLEVLPRLLGQPLREVLDEPRPAGGVQHLPDV
jgi:hypothetical protein